MGSTNCTSKSTTGIVCIAQGAMDGHEARPWIYAGLASSLPSIEPSEADVKAGRTRVCKPPPDPWDEVDPNEPPPPCRIVRAPSQGDTQEKLQELTLEHGQQSVSQTPQVLLFRYRCTSRRRGVGEEKGKEMICCH